MQPVDQIVQATLAHLAESPPKPESTYRLQFHAGFTFRQAADIVPYLHDLGITHVYASPYLQARAGSTHGYDVVNHRVLNPEVGAPADFAALVDALRRHGMSHILDTVPNHMGVANNDNLWWNDVLEHGPASRYHAYFDIAWRGSPRPEMHGKVLLPILGGTYASVLEKGELRLALEHGAFFLHYYERRLPIDPASYALVLARALDPLRQSLGNEHPDLLEYESILSSARRLPTPDRPQPADIDARRHEATVIKHRLAALTERNPAIRQVLRQTIDRFNGNPDDPGSFDPLDELLRRQHYRLACWRIASDEINYRRFFDVNDLAALSMENPEVFIESHAFILELLASRQLAGLRIDHPDGLYDPKRYFEQLQLHYCLACARALCKARGDDSSVPWDQLEPALRDAFSRELAAAGRGRLPVYVSVEKILARGEPLSEEWPVHGTSGYDFLNLLNGLYVDPRGAEPFAARYHSFVQDPTPFSELVYQKKRLILDISLASELHMLARQLDRLAHDHRASRDFTFRDLRDALREVIACFPVYRSYISGEGVRPADKAFIEQALEQAIRRNPHTDVSVFHFIRDTLLLVPPRDASTTTRAEQCRFAGKFQQVTSPVTAKGIEDTAFYIYNRLISLNEVGGEPGHFGLAPASVHAAFTDRQARWPYALSALSTHDTKRSEDVRARINVLSEIPVEWWNAVDRWRATNAPHRARIDDAESPDASEECLLYQTLVGAVPLDFPADVTGFIERIQAYMRKAMREAKIHTRWTDPNAAWEDAVSRFVARILDPQTGAAFLADFVPFQKRISHWGMINSLSQTLLRIAAPGVPDTYQGTEIWDYSLVDPDNRRPVAYDLRRQLLSSLQESPKTAGRDRSSIARQLLQDPADGRPKLLVTAQALACRREHPGLFSIGAYFPLEPAGPHADNVFAFARRHNDHWAIVAVPRLVTRLVQPPHWPCGDSVWGDTRLSLPPQLHGRPLHDRLTGRTVQSHSSLPMANLLSDFPVALLVTSG